MSLRMNLTFFIIFALWRSTLGVIFTVNGQWEAEIEKCRSGSDDNRIYTYNISHQVLNTLPNFNFDSDTTVKVDGIIELTSGFTDPMTINEWLLNEYKESGDVKSYQGELRIDAQDGVASQVAYVGLTLFISPSGEIRFKNYVYAGSWGSVYCSSAKAFIHSIKVGF